MHAKNTRERKKLKLNKLEELANQLEREIEELNHRSMHHDWGSALMVPSQHNTGVGASPAITELQARAGKLAMRSGTGHYAGAAQARECSADGPHTGSVASRPQARFRGTDVCSHVS